MTRFWWVEKVRKSCKCLTSSPEISSSFIQGCAWTLGNHSKPEFLIRGISCLSWHFAFIVPKDFAFSVYLVSDKLQSRNQDVCHQWHGNLLTGCHGDCCQALAETVLRERGTERDTERDEAGHLQAETKRRK